MNLAKRCMVKPGSRVDLSEWDPDEHYGTTRDDGALDKNQKQLTKLQRLLYADRRYALLIVLQALDAGGKDGTIRHVMSGVNPQGCQVTSFKTPSSEEQAHDYLWRVHHAVPGLGEIGIFNRSHYEDVLVVRVHNLVPKEVWSKRYDQINEFERVLTENNVVMLKFFLHISKDEQKKRFEDRVKDPDKNWKLSMADFQERKYWDQYTDAYQAALHKCSTEWAPWYVVPSNDKWFRNFVISSLIVRKLEELDLKYPAPTMDVSKISFD